MENFFDMSTLKIIQRQNEIMQKICEPLMGIIKINAQHSQVQAAALSMQPMKEVISQLTALPSVDVSGISAILNTYSNRLQILGLSQEVIKSIQSGTYFDHMVSVLSSFQNIPGVLLYPYDKPDDDLSDASDEEIAESKEIDAKIISEILMPEKQKILTDDSPIIVCSPISRDVLRYLYENPDEFHKLRGTDFEDVVEKLYSRLGYNVKRTKATRDGGKDIILTDHQPIGDFMYYVECKGYRENRPVGYGYITAFTGVIEANRANGGILVTNSHFTEPGRKYIRDCNLSFRIRLQDGQDVLKLMNQVI